MTMYDEMINKEVILEVKELSKHFGGIKAVNKVNMKLFKNEIIAIVGDNGAGKSTLIKTISGVHKKNGGQIFINGKEAQIENTMDAKQYGIETVYQEEGVISIFNASDNLFLGRERYKSNFLGKWFKFLDFKYMREETEKLLKRLGIELKDIDSEVSNLSGGQRQSIVIGRAAYWGGKIVILDEPTNNLGVTQERRVLEFIKNLRNNYDVSIMVISHNINHVFELVDRIIVLRNGKVVGERIKDKSDTNEVVSLITGVV